jgi:glucose/arabinose dehydrogenase
VLGLIPAMPAPPLSAAPRGYQELQLTQVASGLTTPVDLRAPVGDERLFIVELPGRIRVQENGSMNPTPFLDITSRVSTGGERGLLALAFHPRYDQNGLFYVYYTDNGGDTRISEFAVSPGDPDRAVASSERILLEIDQFASNHNGGGFAFGPDGYLYIGVGDGGGGGDPGENGQNPDTLLGSLLRIDVDGTTGGREYAIPESNPFNDGGGRREVYAYGLRNPWRMSIDQPTGRIFIGDVGQNRREEINTLTTDESKARNFGWDVMEGTLCYEPPSGCDKTGKRRPIVEYDNPEQGVSVIGGYVYRGNAIPWLRGTYFYSDLAGRRLRSFRFENGNVRNRTDWTSQVGLLPSSVFGFGQDGHGEIYVLSGSSAYRIDPANPARCDFDGDGDDDLAVGVPGENRAGVANAGAVHELETRSGEPGPAGDRFWHQDRQGVRGVAHGRDVWGTALSCGDFDGDGFDDLAVGAPATSSANPAGGTVSVLYGSSSGLSTRDQLFRQGKDGLAGRAENGDEFGAALASGDFDGDGFSDLVIGAPGEAIGGKADAGSISVLYGSSFGLETSGNSLIHQENAGIKGVVELGDRFGEALTTGDFDGDGYTDLAVGAPGETVGGHLGAGLVHIIPGRRSGGLTPMGDIVLHQGRTGVKGSPEPNDRFGSALASGPVNADGYDDLVVGVPGQSVGGANGAGSIHYLRGSVSGITPGGDRIIHQDSEGIRGRSQPGDNYGSAVAVGDIDGDGFADLVSGVPGEDQAGISNTGAMSVIFGKSEGPGGRDHLWHQGTTGVPGTDDPGDRFGASLALLDFESDRRLDVVVGAEMEDLGPASNAGQIWVLFGRSSDLVSSGGLRLSQETTGVKGSAQTGDRFGASSGR